MHDDDPLRDPQLAAWLQAAEPAPDADRLDRLAVRIRDRVAAPTGPDLGGALLPWWRVVVPLAAAAGLLASLMVARPNRADAPTESALVLLEAMRRSDGDLYLSDLTMVAHAQGLVGAAARLGR